MAEIKFTELVNIPSLTKMAQNLYEAVGIPIGILDIDGTIYLKVGWQDICTKFHRAHVDTCNRCMKSDYYLSKNVLNASYIEHKCSNNMWDIGVPIIIAGKHLATIFLGQFFYEDETIDIEFFKRQAQQFGFCEKEYLDSLKKVPKFSKKKVNHIIEYYLGLIVTIVESGLRQLEYKNSRTKLSKKQKYLNTIFNLVNDSIIVFNIYGKIIDVNQTAISMFGYSRDELINMDAKQIISEKSTLSKAQIIEAFQNAKYNKPIILECLCIAKDKMEFWAEVNISVIELDDNEEVILVVRNSTQRKLGELEVQKEASEIETIRTEFFANISHELKTPLNIIFGILQIVELEIEDKEKSINREKLLTNLNIEKQSCFRLLRLMNNLIDSTKLDSGNFELNLVNCNIVSVIEEITLTVAKYFNKSNLNIIFDTDVEEKVLACDIDKIERIVLNLLSNAVKFTHKDGRITVNILDGEEYISIIVEDTGIGIPSDKLNIIFDRFRQVDKSFIRKQEGCGMGLSITKSLIETHDGSICVESKEGIGSKFIIKLPIKEVDLKVDKQNLISDISTLENCVKRIKVEFSDIY